MMIFASTEYYQDYAIHIYYDECPENPYREWDRLGTITTAHRYYTIGEPFLFDDEDDLYRFIEAERGDCLPIYMYNHGGIALRTFPFSCPWDSGLIGWVYATAEQMREWFGVKRLSKQCRQKALDTLRAEVAVMSDYVNGNVYGYVVEQLSAKNEDTNPQDMDAYRGFYGMDHEASGLMDSAKATIHDDITRRLPLLAATTPLTLDNKGDNTHA